MDVIFPDDVPDQVVVAFEVGFCGIQDAIGGREKLRRLPVQGSVKGRREAVGETVQLIGDGPLRIAPGILRLQGIGVPGRVPAAKVVLGKRGTGPPHSSGKTLVIVDVGPARLIRDVIDARIKEHLPFGQPIAACCSRSRTRLPTSSAGRGVRLLLPRPQPLERSCGHAGKKCRAGFRPARSAGGTGGNSAAAIACRPRYNPPPGWGCIGRRKSSPGREPAGIEGCPAGSGRSGPGRFPRDRVCLRRNSK